ncbi:putative serine/threonine-protein kinase [Clostridia bacterium]|nr:putative serine/threonine-protein kinase [Clostridia bacterium]
MTEKILEKRYRLEKLIGSGGMSNVYKATDLEENKTVAVKLLRQEFIEKPEFLKRFRAEAQAVTSLAHPNIVKINNVNFRGNEQYLVMEFVDGLTLKQYLDKERVVDRRDAVHFALQILRALNHTHSKGIIHCDIKPHNIMVLDDGTIKMMDFGIARIARDKIQGDGENTLGSVHYLSPEQALGEELDPGSDVYSVGIMLYEMLTGEKPFDGKDVNEIAQKHLYTHPTPPREINPQIPIGLEEIILKALEKNIKQQTRYKDATEMLKDLETFKNNNNITFGYSFEQKKEKVKMFNTNETKYYNPNNLTEQDTEQSEQEYEDDELEDDELEDGESEEVEGKSLFVPILSAVTIVVIIAAVFFVVSLVNDAFGNGGGGGSTNKSTPFELENLIGMTIDEAGDYCKSKGLVLEINQDAIASEYEANIICVQVPAAGKKVKKEQIITVTVSSGMPLEVQVPDLLGQDYKTAQSVLEQNQLEYSLDFVQSNSYSLYQVCEVDPPVGSKVAVGTIIKMKVSTGMDSIPEVEVPNFYGMNITDAQLAAQHAGLILKINPTAENSSEPKDSVIRQNPAKGSVVIKGVEVVVTLSNGVAPMNEVTVNITLPEGYSGAYIIELRTEPAVSKSFNVESNASISFTISGTGKKDIIATLYTADKLKNAVIGVVGVDFTTKDVDKSLLNINGAFAAIGEKAVTTQEPATTAKTSTTSTTTTATETTTSTSTSSETSTTTTTTTSETQPQPPETSDEEPVIPVFAD